MKILSAAALLTGLLLSARAPTEGPVTYALAPDQLADDGVHALTLDISAPDPELHGQGPFPAIVWIHGGGWRYGNLYDGFGKGVLVHGPERGYVGVSINYRLTLDEDEDGDPRFPWPAQIQDSRCALRWLSNSGGGHLALLLSQGSDQSQWDTDFCEHDGAVGPDLGHQLDDAGVPGDVPGPGGPQIVGDLDHHALRAGVVTERWVLFLPGPDEDASTPK